MHCMNVSGQICVETEVGSSSHCKMVHTPARLTFSIVYPAGYPLTATHGRADFI